MSNSNPLVPGGGLTAHEIAGGHTLTRHVGKTEAELVARLASEPRNLVSSFTDRAIAEAVISEAIDANQTVIATWLSSNPTQSIPITYTTSSTAGVSLLRGTASTVPASQVLVVLKPDSSLPLGYYILTAYLKP